MSNFGLKTTPIPPKPRFSTSRKPTKAQSGANDSMLNTDQKKLTYLGKEDLTPIEGNLDAAIKAMNQDLKNDDWQKQFEGLNLARRLSQHHTTALTTSSQFNLHSTISDILKHIDSLRSNVSKNALIALNEICQTIKKGLDSEVDTILLRLIKKSNDTSQFISEEVRKCLVSLSQNCSDTKVIPVLSSLNNQKANSAKINICYSLEAVVQKHQNKIT